MWTQPDSSHGLQGLLSPSCYILQMLEMELCPFPFTEVGPPFTTTPLQFVLSGQRRGYRAILARQLQAVRLAREGRVSEK